MLESLKFRPLLDLTSIEIRSALANAFHSFSSALGETSRLAVIGVQSQVAFLFSVALSLIWRHLILCLVRAERGNALDSDEAINLGRSVNYNLRRLKCAYVSEPGPVTKPRSDTSGNFWAECTSTLKPSNFPFVTL